MKKLLTVLFILVNGISWSQEEILNQCVVFILEADVKSDVRSATFDLPFAAMSASKKNEKTKVPHFFFDVQSADTGGKSLSKGLKVVSIRNYEYGETLGDNEIAFFIMEWPASHRPKGMGPILASFPSINGFDVLTDHFVFQHPIDLPEILVSQLKLDSNQIKPGKYSLVRVEVEL